jgi:putative Mg2+ transporter-C (MgtC) family protein
MENVLSVIPLEWGGIGSALLAGSIIGLERQIMGKAVGIRTSSLICLATYIFIAMSYAATELVSTTTVVSDPSRIIGQVVTGVGFLGAGVIIARDGVVLGVTSAAVIWILAAIGVVIGVGHHVLGILLALLTVAVLVGLDYMESGFKWLQRSVDETFIHRPKIDKNNDVPPDADDSKEDKRAIL